jgi:hypothetical protein
MTHLFLAFVLLSPFAPTSPPKVEPKPKRLKVGNNVFFEVEGKQRRVIVNSKVVLTKGPLEGLLTIAGKKEHEYILGGDFDARHLHAALNLAGGKEGSPVKFAPKFKPPTGSKVKVALRYKKGGKSITVPASAWIKHHKTGKPLSTDFVFAGSRTVPNLDPQGKPIYLANYGDIICLCNMDSALLDIPVASPKALEDRVWEANTTKLPPKDTVVEVIFEVIPEKKK